MGILLDHGRIHKVVEDPVAALVLDGNDLAGLVLLPVRIETGKQKAWDKRRTRVPTRASLPLPSIKQGKGRRRNRGITAPA